MKKAISVFLIVVLVCGFFLMNQASISKVLAISGTSTVTKIPPSTATVTPPPSIAPGAWSDGTEFYVDLETNPSPYSWLELVSNGIKLDSAGEVCHEFRGGQYGWVGMIKQLVDGKWVKVPSTQGWVPNEEGKYMICADVKSAGTYALFAYYSK